MEMVKTKQIVEKCVCHSPLRLRAEPLRFDAALPLRERDWECERDREWERDRDGVPNDET